MAIREEGKRVPVVMTRDKDKKGFYYINEGPNYVNVKGNKFSFTVRASVIEADSTLGIDLKYAKSDRDFDRLHKRIFGHDPIFEDNEEGYVTSYRDDGSRYFSLPTDNDLDFPVNSIQVNHLRQLLKM